MDIDAIVNGALESAETAANELKVDVLAAVKALVENLIATLIAAFHKLVGVELL